MVSCQTGQKAEIKTIAPSEFDALLAATTSPQLIDVRTPEEFESEHLKHAINIDWRGNDFEAGLRSLNKDEPVFLYCLSGGRSSSAASKLSSLSFTQIYDLKGGILAWKNAEMPIEKGKNAISKEGMSQAEYEQQLESEIPVLVNFYAPWCSPCRKMAPMLEALKKEKEGQFKFVKLNADENEVLMKALEVNEIPTFLIYKNGQLSWKNIGLTERSLLLNELGLN